MSRALLFLAVIVAGICTTIMNYRFAYQLGHDQLDKTVWGVFSIALDICKWFILAVSLHGTKPQRLAGVLIWLVATSYSFMAAIGFAALNRDTTRAERADQAEIRRTIDLMKKNPAWEATAACTNATIKKSKEFCEEYRAKEGKLVGVIDTADPQSALFARLTGYNEDQVRIGLAIFLAVTCEIVSALGLYSIVQRQAPQQTPSPAVNVKFRPKRVRRLRPVPVQPSSVDEDWEP